MCMGGGGGGETTTTTIDPVYNAGLLEMAQEDQGFKRTFMNMFQYGVPYDPNEQTEGAYIDGKWVNKDDLTPDQVGAEQYIDNPDLKPGTQGMGQWEDARRWDEFAGESGMYINDRKWVPNEGLQEKILNPGYTGIETRTRGDIEGYDPSAQTSEMQYLQNLVKANQELLPFQTDVSKKELGLAGDIADSSRGLLPFQTEASKQAALLSGETSAARREILPGRTDLAKTTLADINKGIDVGGRMDEAQAGVQHGMKLANEATRKDISSFGLDPSAGRYTGMRRDLAMKEATGIAAARTGAKNLAEDEDFKRKITGLQLIQ